MSSRSGAGSPVHGVVEAFDAAAGLGTVRSDDGTAFGFHCTQIADGTRTIEAGTAVSFHVRAGRLGRWEAGGVAPAPA